MPTDTKIDQRRATFRAACRGLSAWQTAKACNRLTPLTREWRGATKRSMSEEFESGALSGFTWNQLQRAVDTRNSSDGCIEGVT